MPEDFGDPSSGLVEKLATQLLSAKLKIATVESCTGGLISALFTDIAGSSTWFDRGFVTYTNASKVQMVGVNPDTLRAYGEVSEAVAREMALGACAYSDASCALSVSGIAGPGGGSESKPVGMVCFAWAGFSEGAVSNTQYFDGDRHAVRAQSTRYAIERAIALFSEKCE